MSLGREILHLFRYRNHLYSIDFKLHPADQTMGHAVVSAKCPEQADNFVSDRVYNELGYYVNNLETEVQRAEIDGKVRRGVISLRMPSSYEPNYEVQHDGLKIKDGF